MSKLSPRVDRPASPAEYGVTKASEFPEYRMTAEVYRSRGAIAIRPRKVISWTDITADPTRFRFDG